MRRISLRQALAVLVGSLLTVAAILGVLFSNDGGTKITGVATIFSVVIVIPSVFGSIGPTRGPGPDPSETDLRNAASRIAKAAQQRWSREAAMRRITVPATVRVSWKRAGGGSDVARPPRGARPREIPTQSPSELLDEGMLSELQALYSHPDVDNIIVLGEAGAGKSGLLIQLLLEALRAREQTPEASRYDVPVAVLLTLGDWDPEERTLLDWADGVLRRDYGPAVTSEGTSVYRALLEDGRITLFLDGLDEMPKTSWLAAAQEIQEATHVRVVLSARPEAAHDAHVSYATRIVLEPIGVEDAAEYLRSACDRRVHPDDWDAAILELTRNPHGVPATALSTPLMLTLALNAFDRPDADPRDLADERRFPTAAALEGFLLSQIVPLAYSQPDGRGRQSTGPTAEVAERYLRALATRMGDARDLAWWRIRRWVPEVAPAVVCLGFMCAVGIDAGILGGVDVGLAIGVPGAISAPIAGAAIARLAIRRRQGQARGAWPRFLVSVLVGFSFGACLVLVPRIEAGRYPAGLGIGVLGAALGVLGGVAVGVLASHDGPLVATPRRVSLPDVLFGGAAGLSTGLTYGLADGSWMGVGLGIVASLGFMVGIAWTRPSDFPEGGATPLSSFRRDLRGAALLTAIISITATAAFAVVLSRKHDAVTAILAAAGLSFPFAALIGVATSQACALSLTSWWLRLRTNRFPGTLLALVGAAADAEAARGVRAAGFLEDAHRRDILRSVGTLYQFRHGRLQEQLREEESELRS